MERKMRLAAPGLSQLCDDLGGLEQCSSKDRGSDSTIQGRAQP